MSTGLAAELRKVVAFHESKKRNAPELNDGHPSKSAKKSVKSDARTPTRPIHVKKEQIDEDEYSDSDSEINFKNNKKKTEQAPLALPPPPALPPMSSVPKTMIKAPPAPPAAKPQSKSNVKNNSLQQKKIYTANVEGKHDEARLFKLPDFLSTGELNADHLQELEKLYLPQIWEVNGLSGEKALFQEDLAEQRRYEMQQLGTFSPEAFALIKRMQQRKPLVRLSNSQMQHEMANLYKIELVSRKFEEKSLCKPRDGENPCVRGSKCLCKQWFGFIMVEFLTPMEMANMKTSNRGDVIKPCLLCTRMTIDFLQTLYVMSGLKNPDDCVMQSHRNPVNVVGEYVSEDTFPLENGILYPVVANNRMAYKHHKDPRTNNEWLTQDGYKVCTQEDINRQNFHNGTPRPRNHGSERATAAAEQPQLLLAAGDEQALLLDL